MLNLGQLCVSRVHYINCLWYNVAMENKDTLPPDPNSPTSPPQIGQALDAPTSLPQPEQIPVKAPNNIYPTPESLNNIYPAAKTPEAKAEERRSQQKSNRKISVGAFVTLAFFLGNFGVHDFVVGRKKQGIWHLVLLVLPFLVSRIYIAVMYSAADNSNLTAAMQLASAANTVAFALYAITGFNALWSLFEAVIYARNSVRSDEFTVVKNSYKGITVASIVCSALAVVTAAAVLFAAVSFSGGCNDMNCANMARASGVTMVLGAILATSGLYFLICSLVMYKNILTADKAIKGVKSIKNWAVALFGLFAVLVIALIVLFFVSTSR